MKRLYEFYRFALIEKDTIIGKRQYIDHPGAVVIIAIDDEGRVLFERNLRVEVDEELLELPAGLVEEGEERVVTAKRELLEETGYIASDWQELYTYYNSAGILNETTTVFLATGLVKQNNHLDESEKKTLLEVQFIKQDDILEVMLNTKNISSDIPVVAFGINQILSFKKKG